MVHLARLSYYRRRLAYAASFTLPAAAAVTPLAPCREDTLTQLFLNSVRRGKEVEACLAAKALGLHVTTLGASTASEGIYREVRMRALLCIARPLITGQQAATAGEHATMGRALRVVLAVALLLAGEGACWQRASSSGGPAWGASA